VLVRTQEEAAVRIADLERQLAELRAAAASDDGHLAAATARVAELEAAQAAGESALGAALAEAREEVARTQAEKAALDAAHESLAARNVDLEEQLRQLEAATARVAQLEQQVEGAAAQIAHLEAERNDVLAVAKALGEERRGRHHDHAEDPSHLLFVPGVDGYRLLEQDGPPPAPGTTLELPADDGTRSRLLVAKVGAAPLPGTRVACAYLVPAA